MQQYSTAWIFGFAFMVCLVCSLLVSLAAVSLHERQEVNRRIHKLKSVLEAGRLIEPGARLTAAEMDAFFESPAEDAPADEPVLEARVIDLRDAVEVDVDAATFEEEHAEWVRPGPNPAGLQEIPRQRVVFLVTKGGELQQVILPVEGQGLWSTLHGFIALGPDLNTVEGLTYYDHGETPGLGGEVDNPNWKRNWRERKIYDNGEVAVEVIKGSAPPPSEDPHKVDGLSGATLTARGVTNMMRFWFGDTEYSYKAYLDTLREQFQAS